MSDDKAKDGIDPIRWHDEDEREALEQDYRQRNILDTLGGLRASQVQSQTRVSRTYRDYLVQLEQIRAHLMLQQREQAQKRANLTTALQHYSRQIGYFHSTPGIPYGTGINTKNDNDTPNKPTLPKPSVWRAIKEACSLRSPFAWAWDAVLLLFMPFYAMLAYLATDVWEGAANTAYFLASVCVFFKRGRMIVQAWKNQQLMYFTGALPDEYLEIADIEATWMNALQILMILGAVLFMFIRLYAAS